MLRGGISEISVQVGAPTESVADQEKIKALFPNTYGKNEITFTKGANTSPAKKQVVGVILSGGQAPGGHNVIAGIYDGIKSLNKASRMFGFKGGPSGLVDNDYVEITDEFMNEYRNTGGFDMIGSGRTKLEQVEQFDKGAVNCKALGISALVIIGGDDSNTNACLLAEYYKAKNIPIQVIGCPKTIDGDLKNKFIETSFGFDTASKVYSELIGNISRDANSAKKYWHFIKLMGRSASHITLECALKTHVNAAIISEEVAAKKQTLSGIVDDLAKIVAKRAENKENFGVVLVPEGLIEFIPEMKVLIGELNDVLAVNADEFNAIAKPEDKIAYISGKLSAASASVYAQLPTAIQLQLSMDRDPHGNVQVSLIETEKLLAQLVKQRLSAMKAEGKYVGKFSSQTHFFGYEGRCAAPSNFDADYCYSLGFNAAAIIGSGATAYMSYVGNLAKSADEWTAGAVPLTAMMNVEHRHGADKPVIKKALVELDDAPFKFFAANRGEWAVNTSFVYPGPIQYFGPSVVCDAKTETIKLEHQ
jgi:pyrophosphate--fructose-6-phosphate 1-phosphotransferase